MQANTLSRYCKQRGDTLLEVLISVLVFSFGLVGLASLQISTMQKGRETTEYTIAMQLAGDLAEQMRANPEALSLGWDKNPTELPRENCEGEQCASRAFTVTGLEYWQASLVGRLPNATAHVCRDTSPNDGLPGVPQCDGQGAYMIKIWWPNQDGELQSYHQQAGLL